MRTPFAFALLSLVLAGCGGGGYGSGGGGGGGGGPPPNVEAVVVDAGPAALPTPAANIPYITVKICVAGTTNCQTFDHIEIDTGSVGLRILADAQDTSSHTFNLPLAPVLDGGKAVAECLQFADGNSWGAVATAVVGERGWLGDGWITGRRCGPSA